MVETNKRHFGDPVQKKPVNFGKHYIRNNKINTNDTPSESIKLNETVNNITTLKEEDLLAIEQRHRHSIEKNTIKCNTFVNCFGIACWLVFCLALVYIGLCQLENSLVFAISIPVAGFAMICCLAYLKKTNFSNKPFENRHNTYSSTHHSNKFQQNKFRKSYKHRSFGSKDSQ